LLAAMSRYAFDTVLVPINASDPGHNPFITTVIAEARKQNMGVIGMKVLARGRLIETGASSAKEAIRYAMAHCDTAIIGCATPDEIRGNLAIGRTENALDEPERRTLEARLSPDSTRYSFYKA
jgi:predicted aldo/keto reductase-like oxidoreductase